MSARTNYVLVEGARWELYSSRSSAITMDTDLLAGPDLDTLADRLSRLRSESR